MPQVNPIDYSFHIKTGDLLPALKIQIFDGNTSEPFNLDGYTGEFFMAPNDDWSNPIVDGGLVTITDAANGLAEYQWQVGDTDTKGIYVFEFRFSKYVEEEGRTFTIPIFSPGKVVIETKIGDA